MKKLVGIVLIFVCMLAVTAPASVQNEPSQSIETIDINLNINTGIQLQDNIQIALEALEIGEPITFRLPKNYTDPKVCCQPPGECSGAYCCYRC